MCLMTITRKCSSEGLFRKKQCQRIKLRCMKTRARTAAGEESSEGRGGNDDEAEGRRMHRNFALRLDCLGGWSGLGVNFRGIEKRGQRWAIFTDFVQADRLLFCSKLCVLLARAHPIGVPVGGVGDQIQVSVTRPRVWFRCGNCPGATRKGKKRAKPRGKRP